MKDKYEVTDHAIIRYLERAHEIDISSIRQQMSDFLSKKLPRKPNGKCTVKMADGIKLVLVDGVLITVWKKKR